MIKKIFLFKFTLFLTIIASGLNAAYNPEIPANKLKINYLRVDEKYDDLGIWFWDDVKHPPGDWPSDAIALSPNKDRGASIQIQLASNAKKIGFLIVNRKNGEKEAGNKVFEMTKEDNEIWIREKDNQVYLTPDFRQVCRLVSAYINGPKKIELIFDTNLSMISKILLKSLKITDSNGTLLEPEEAVIDEKKAIIHCDFKYSQAPLTIEFNQNNTKICDLSWNLIDELFFYDGNDLGCTMTGTGSAELKLWAPRARKVALLIFAAENQQKIIGRKEMHKADKGIWLVSVNENEFDSTGFQLYNSYYQYEVTNPGKKPVRVLDPYASSMAPVTVSSCGSSAGDSKDFIGKAAFVNALKTGKTPGSASIKGYKERQDAIIYEVHIRDFTSDPEIRDSLNAEWGTFAAFKSRLSYIRSLGITHIQLLPVMAWYYGDETKMRAPELNYSSRNNNYNWGYDPHNYFSIDGAYSQDVEQADKRIKEFKALVDAIHQQGMGVILDVVYTHMAKADFLENIVPDYYFFRNSNQTLIGDFGNNLATNRKMAEKLMIDSVRHWFGIYKIDGMRWDMMGDATRESVEKCFAAAREINPDAIFIGEGWRTFKGHIDSPELKGQGADQDWMAETNSVGVFSDEFRNILKSGFGSEGEPRFLTGGKVNIQNLFANIKAQPSNTPVTSPGDMVQYIAAHDNLPLFDVIAQSIKKDPDIEENYLEIHKRIRLGNLLLLTSQGTSFIHAGQEFGRSKQWRTDRIPEQKYHHLKNAEGNDFKYPYFIHDSYDSSDAINMISWQKATNIASYPINVTTREYTAGLIKLRRDSDAFRQKTFEQIERKIRLLSFPETTEEDLVIAFSCEDSSKRHYHIFINADDKTRKLTLKENLQNSEVIVDQESAGTDALAKPKGFKLEPDGIEIKPLTGVVFRSRK